MDYEHHVAHLREEANYEIARLEALLRDPRMTAEESEALDRSAETLRSALRRVERKAA